MKHLTATELRRKMDSGELAPVLLDVREPWEFDICHIEGAMLVPMGQLPERLAQLDAARDTVVVCHHGIRSLQVCFYLEHAGFSRLYNLDGGVAAWAHEVEPGMATY
jgi:rhodanese-related sulfurtransferase